MDLQIPEAFLQVAQCFAHDKLGDGRTLVGLCTSSGQLLELIDRKVMDSFDLDKDADEIMIFTSYNPVQKYYLVRCKKQLIVVKRSAPLCIIKTYEDVIKVEMQDRLCIGRPQVVIWTLTNKEPVVTDFVNELYSSGPQPVPHTTTFLNGKLQEMNLRLEKARRLLQEKRKTRVNALYELTPHLKPPDGQTESEMVLAWGPPFPVKKEVCQPPLQLSELWRRAHNGKWIVGVPVFNTSAMSVQDVRLRLQMDGQPELRYESHLIVFPQRISTGAEWLKLRERQKLFQKQPNIPGRTPAVVVGVIDEPVFKSSSEVSISGALIYKKCDSEGNNVQDILNPAVQFKVEDLIQGSLQPFSSQDSFNECDLVSVVVTSSHWKLRVSTLHLMPAELKLSNLGLQWQSSIGCWVGPQVGSLAGLIIIDHQISGSQYLMDVYAKDLKQAMQFIHSLCSQWKVEECKDAEVTFSSCIKSLAAELQLLLTELQPNTVFTPEKWSEFRSKLNSLELATDLNFLSFSPSS